jgi:acyl carrier protein
MGLDVVELVMEWEKFFQISIADNDAEKMCTVQDAVEQIAKILKIETDTTIIRDIYFEKLEAFIKAVHPDKIISLEEMQYTDTVEQYFDPTNQEMLSALELAIGLPIPSPWMSNVEVIRSVFYLFGSTAKPLHNSPLTIGKFIDSTLAANYKEVISEHGIEDTYAVLIGVVGITSEKCSVPIYEINLSSNFVSDLGID